MSIAHRRPNGYNLLELLLEGAASTKRCGQLVRQERFESVFCTKQLERFAVGSLMTIRQLPLVATATMRSMGSSGTGCESGHSGVLPVICCLHAGSAVEVTARRVIDDNDTFR